MDLNSDSFGMSPFKQHLFGPKVNVPWWGVMFQGEIEGALQIVFKTPDSDLAGATGRDPGLGMNQQGIPLSETKPGIYRGVIPFHIPCCNWKSYAFDVLVIMFELGSYMGVFARHGHPEKCCSL